jgi:integrase
MPKRSKYELIQCRFFRWRLKPRNGIWHADGRSNETDLGRHSLGTRDVSEAKKMLQDLDLVKAVEHGLADSSQLNQLQAAPLSLETGRLLYEQHVSRPQIVGGARPKTVQRYKAVLDKFLPFAINNGVRCWNDVDVRLLEKYAKHLEALEYAYRTLYLELNTIKQIAKWLIRQGHLAGKSPIDLPVAKADGTPTYCWRAEEVEAIVEWCTKRPELVWLGHVIIALACTGLRISELASLRWTDLDFQNEKVRLTDETAASRRKAADRRTTKSGRGRTFPIHRDLLGVLKTLTKTDPYVFHGPRGGRLKPDTIRRILIRDVLTPLAERFPSPEGEVGFVDGRLHSFRHYFCSTCANNNIPEQMVMQWLGHQESDMVKHYYHLHDEEARRRMGGLNFLGRAGGTSADAQHFENEGSETKAPDPTLAQ